MSSKKNFSTSDKQKIVDDVANILKERKLNILEEYLGNKTNVNDKFKWLLKYKSTFDVSGPPSRKDIKLVEQFFERKQDIDKSKYQKSEFYSHANIPAEEDELQRLAANLNNYGTVENPKEKSAFNKLKKLFGLLKNWEVNSGLAWAEKNESSDIGYEIDLPKDGDREKKTDEYLNQARAILESYPYRREIIKAISGLGTGNNLLPIEQLRKKVEDRWETLLSEGYSENQTAEIIKKEINDQRGISTIKRWCKPEYNY